jgi:hypothetical protein
MGMSSGYFANYNGTIFGVNAFYEGSTRIMLCDPKIIPEGFSINKRIKELQKTNPLLSSIYERTVDNKELIELFTVSLMATYDKMTFNANITRLGKLSLLKGSDIRQDKDVIDKENSIYLPLGFKRDVDFLNKIVEPEESSEIYEVRTDRIIPAYFIPGVTTELTADIL